MTNERRQGRYWLCTLKAQDVDRETLVPPFTCPGDCSWVIGQLECGESTDYFHWQFLAVFKRKVSRRRLQESFSSSGHYELSRSSCATDYVQKEDTRVAGSQFEFGSRPVNRASQSDWDDIWLKATSGEIMGIPSDIRVINCFILDSLLFFFAKDPV